MEFDCGHLAAPVGIRCQLVMKIGYLIPEFPGQTHIMMWRERIALLELGYQVHLFSTRPPKDHRSNHSWAAEAEAETVYALPRGWREFARAAWALLSVGPGRILLAARHCLGARELQPKERLLSLALMVPAARLAAEARRQGVRHLHVHSCHRAALLALMARSLTGLTYSLVLHSPIKMYGPLQREKWRHAAFGIAVTQVLYSEVVEVVPDVLDRVVIAPMGVDTRTFSRAAPYPPHHDGLVVKLVSCGRLHPQKGHQDVIRAVALLRGEGLPAELTILGEGPARKMLEGLIRELNLSDSVRLLGSVSEEEVVRHLVEADAFALGSHDEAIGVATMEAMSMGVPVIVTDVGGVRELVRQGEDGLLVKANDPEGMAAAIQSVLSDRPEAKAMGESGRRRILHEFDHGRSARAIISSLEATWKP